jgi:hypothetical protein
MEARESSALPNSNHVVLSQSVLQRDEKNAMAAANGQPFDLDLEGYLKRMIPDVDESLLRGQLEIAAVAERCLAPRIESPTLEEVVAALTFQSHTGEIQLSSGAPVRLVNTMNQDSTKEIIILFGQSDRKNKNKKRRRKRREKRGHVGRSTSRQHPRTKKG